MVINNIKLINHLEIFFAFVYEVEMTVIFSPYKYVMLNELTIYENEHLKNV